jgi:hypothetical protein
LSAQFAHPWCFGEKGGLDEINHLNELSGELTYQISPGASFTWKAGVLKPEISGLYKGNEAQSDPAFATYGRFQKQF